jgi:hypothetical protein
VYGLTPDVDVSFLAGAELQQVAVGQNEVILNFGSRVSVTVASDLRLSSPHDQGDLITDAPTAGSALIALLGSTVLQATGIDGTLTLKWSDAGTLAVYDSSPDYESYTITHDGGIIVV